MRIELEDQGILVKYDSTKVVQQVIIQSGDRCMMIGTDNLAKFIEMLHLAQDIMEDYV